MDNTFIISSALSPEKASIEEIAQLCDKLSQQGELRVGFRVEAGPTSEDNKVALNRSVTALKARVAANDLDVEARKPEIMGSEYGAHYLDVYVWLETNVIRIDQGPFSRRDRSEGFSRIRQMLRRNRPFTIIYTFKDLRIEWGAKSRRHNSRNITSRYIQETMASIIWGQFQRKTNTIVIRQDWPVTPQGLCRIDIRIEPKEEGAS